MRMRGFRALDTSPTSVDGVVSARMVAFDSYVVYCVCVCVFFNIIVDIHIYSFFFPVKRERLKRKKKKKTLLIWLN